MHVFPFLYEFEYYKKHKVNESWNSKKDSFKNTAKERKFILLQTVLNLEK